MRKNRGNNTRIVSKSRTTGQTGALAMAQKAINMVQKLTSIINVEFKYFEYDANFTPTYNGSLLNICSPSQGISVNQREGDSMKMKTCQLTGEILGSANGPEVIRLLVFIDKQANIGSTGSNLLENAGSASAVRSSLNQDYKNDVLILVDDSFVLDTYHPCSIFNYIIPIEMHQHFVAASTSVRNNGLTVAVFSQFATASPTVSYHAHTTYVDN